MQQVRLRLHRRDAAKQLQKNVLRDLFGNGAIGEEVIRDAEDYALILLDDRRERVVVATLRPAQGLVRCNLGNRRH